MLTYSQASGAMTFNGLQLAHGWAGLWNHS